MDRINFTVAEENIVSIYKKDTKKETIEAMMWVVPYIDDNDIKALISHTAMKLDLLDEETYKETVFVFTEPSIE